MLFEVPRSSTHQNFKNELYFLQAALKTSVGKELVANGLGGYESETLSAAVALVETQQIAQFADVGANIGIYSLLLGSIYGPSLRIEAYEPLPYLRELGCSLSSANELEIIFRSEALSDQKGTATFYISAKSDSSNSLNPSFRESKGTLEVVTDTLDTRYPKNSPRPRLIKIDTESTEPLVLKGGNRLVAEERPWIICEVLAGRGEEQLTSFFESHKYHAFHLTGAPLATTSVIKGDPSYKHRDWLFAPEIPDTSLNESYVRWQTAFSSVRQAHRTNT